MGSVNLCAAMKEMGLHIHTLHMNYLWVGYKKYIIKSVLPHPEQGRKTVFVFCRLFVLKCIGKYRKNVLFEEKHSYTFQIASNGNYSPQTYLKWINFRVD